MSGNKSAKIKYTLIILALIIMGTPTFAAAQSTGDSLPTQTSTPRRVVSTPQSTLTPTPSAKIWTGRLVSSTRGFTTGNGSVFRIKVAGRIGERIELRSGDSVMTGESGSKPEYGPDVAEFAPVTEGTWTISVPALNVGLVVVADNYSLAIVEFSPVPVPQATRAGQPSATPTPVGGQIWQGKLISETESSGTPFSRLLVTVQGLQDHPVRLSTLAQVINTANTGQKLELGPDVVEFSGLTPAKYIVEPLGLNVSFEVDLRPNIETRIEFKPLPLPPTVTPTSTPLPPLATATPAPFTATATPTLTPQPTDTATPTVTPTVTNTPTPLSSPTPVTRWMGLVADREIIAETDTQVVVRVSGLQDIPVRLRAVADGLNSERRCITGQSNGDASSEGQDTCAFENLPPGPYVVTPEGLDLSLPLTLLAHERITVAFNLEVLPPGISGWQTRLKKNTNDVLASGQQDSTLRVWVEGQAGQVIALRSVRGTERLCEVTANPILGGLVCEFGGLSPGVYLVEPLNTGVGYSLFVDGVGQAELVFAPNATYATLAAQQSPPVAGHGASANQPTPTPSPTTAVVRPTVTPTPSPTITLTPTPAFAWQGRVVETVNGVSGTLGVRAAGLKDHPVILRSGGWQTAPQLTGTKPELGDYATEFGGLAPGEYIVELVDLAQLKVTLEPDQFMLVEFRYDFVTAP